MTRRGRGLQPRNVVEEDTNAQCQACSEEYPRIRHGCMLNDAQLPSAGCEEVPASTLDGYRDEMRGGLTPTA